MRENNNLPEIHYGTRACRRVKNAIENWYLCGGDGADVLPIINALTLTPAPELILPVEMSASLFGDTPVEELKPGDTCTVKEDTKATVQRIALPDGSYLTPVFTSLDELMKGQGTDSITMAFPELLDLVLTWDSCAGIVINPWGNGYLMPRDMLPAVKEHKPSSRIVIAKGDITKFYGDVIVNAARHSLLGGGGVDGAIHRAAGPELLEECKTLHGCPTGGVAVTGGYNLNCEYIFHTVGPKYKKDRNPEGLLSDCYLNVLTDAMDEDVHSVVFPCISTGSYGFPKEKAAQIALHSVCDFLKGLEHDGIVMTVYFCCHSDEDYAAYLKLTENPVSQDVRDLEEGNRAYQKGDYKTAVRHYRRAAEAGNVEALSNLGYCYYYGRSIPVDKDAARECWEEAAILGDICAIYKLGDMYRNGDLPANVRRSKAYYHRAFRLASDTHDVWCYPDCCLRMVKFCAEDFTDEQLLSFCEDAVRGFEERMNKYGDTLSDGILQEARELRSRYLKKLGKS